MMKNWNDSLIALTSRVSEGLGPVSTLIDTMTDRLLGKKAAQACYSFYCGYYCRPYLCTSTTQVRVRIYSPASSLCNSTATCTVTDCGC